MSSGGLQAEGRFWLNRQGQPLLGQGRVQLLEHIERSGSIAEAARVMGMGYKTAWDMVDAMNNLAERPLVERQKGGKHGGGTRLTEYGRQVIALYRDMEREYAQALTALLERYPDALEMQALCQRLGMVASARNQLLAYIESIQPQGSGVDIRLSLGAGDWIGARLTQASVERLQLKVGSSVIALIKATAVRLAPLPSPDYGIQATLEISTSSAQEWSLRLRSGRTLYASVAGGEHYSEGMVLYPRIDPTSVILAHAPT